MKIYTRTGDDGSTGLFGGGRVRKSDSRIECYGTVDELNAHIGLAVAAGAAGDSAQLLEQLVVVQSELFVVGSHLATPLDSAGMKHLPPLEEAMAARLEREIDAAEAMLEPL